MGVKDPREQKKTKADGRARLRTLGFSLVFLVAGWFAPYFVLILFDRLVPGSVGDGHAGVGVGSGGGRGDGTRAKVITPHPLKNPHQCCANKCRNSKSKGTTPA